MTPAATGRLRVLVLASTYPRWAGDPEPGFVHELSRRLAERFDVTVVTPHARGSAAAEVLDQVRVVRYRYAPQRLETLVHDGGIVNNLRRSAWKWLLLPSFVLGQLLAMRRLARELRPDVIHAHWLLPQGLLAALLSALGVRIPLVVTSHGADLYALNARPLRALKRMVVRRAHALTVVSHAMIAPLQALGADPTKISVRPMGVDLAQRFAPVQTQRSGDELLFVGRLVEKKGLQHLLRAMPRVLASRPATRLTVVGFGPQREEMLALADELGLGASVRFVGAIGQDALPEYYRRAAVFVAPFVRAHSGDQEGLGLVVAEALGCDCPVIVGDVPAMRDFPVTPVDATDETALAAAIVDLLEHPQAARDAAAMQRSRIRQQLDWAGVADGYAGLLQAAKISR